MRSHCTHINYCVSSVSVSGFIQVFEEFGQCNFRPTLDGEELERTICKMMICSDCCLRTFHLETVRVTTSTLCQIYHPFRRRTFCCSCVCDIYFVRLFLDMLLFSSWWVRPLKQLVNSGVTSFKFHAGTDLTDTISHSARELNITQSTFC